MKTRFDFIGIPLDNISMSETLERIDHAILSKKQIHHCVINAGKVVKIQSNKLLKQSVASSDIINADGMSILLAAKFLGFRIKERVAGIDLIENLVELAVHNGLDLSFLLASVFQLLLIAFAYLQFT